MTNLKRLAVFAHYDKDSIIDDYVIYYVKALKKVAEKIIFVSDCDLTQVEQDKLIGIVDVVIAQKHSEYDFGSYKRGFLYAKENDFLKDFDECIFANDSCYGPFQPLVPIFDKMEQKGCDFWGITQNKYGVVKKKIAYMATIRPHVQSYFLVVKKDVFSTQIFVDFLNNVKKENDKFDVIINYEIGLSETLSRAGFEWEAYIEAFSDVNASILHKWDDLILNYNMPFLKCSLPRLKHQKSVAIKGFEDVIRKVSDYPVEMIESNVKRTLFEQKIQFPLPFFLVRFAFKLVYVVKLVLRKLYYTLAKIFS